MFCSLVCLQLYDRAPHRAGAFPPLSGLCNTRGLSQCGVLPAHVPSPAMCSQPPGLSPVELFPSPNTCLIALDVLFPCEAPFLANIHSSSRAQLECHHFCDFSWHIPVQLYSTTNYTGVIFPTSPWAAGKMRKSFVVQPQHAACVRGVSMEREPRGGTRAGEMGKWSSRSSY